MITRALTGVVLRPDGQGITSGTVVATPLMPVPATGVLGVLAPTRYEYTITAGEISGSIVAPCEYLFEVYDGSRLVWRFRRAVAEVASATTIQAIYSEAAELPSYDPDALMEGDDLVLLGSAGASAGQVATADGAGGIGWTSAESGDMTKAVYDTNDDGVVGAADAAPWAGITGKPATFPPDTHAHAAADVTSGQLGAARGGTGQDSSAWTGVPKVAAGTWSAGAAAADVDAIPTDAGIVAVNGARDLASTDAGKILECNGTFTLTAPNGLDAGFQVTVINVGAGTITLAATTTLQSKGAKTKLASQYGAATLYHRGSNVWLAVGDLST